MDSSDSEYSKKWLAVLTQTNIPSSDVLPGLHKCLDAEILKRLPVKFLARYKCVSHPWKELIESPIFKKVQLEFSLKASTRFLLCHFAKNGCLSLGTEDLVGEYRDSPSHGRILIRGQCNGMLLFSDYGRFTLWNPSIREQKELLLPSDFSQSGRAFGLGFDSSSDDYKVVMVPYASENLHPQVGVFSLNSNSWRMLPREITPPPFPVENIAESVCIDGGLYWWDYNLAVAQRFDLADETFKAVPLPLEEMGDITSARPWFGCLEGSLCLSKSEFRGSEVNFDIWTTKNDLIWEKLIAIRLNSLTPFKCTPLCFTTSGELLMIGAGEVLFAYDRKSKICRKVRDLRFQYWAEPTVYPETLVSPIGN